MKRKELHKDIVAKNNGLKFLRIEEVDEQGVSYLFENNVLKVHTNWNTKYITICTLVLQCMRDNFGVDTQVNVDDDVVQQAFTEMSKINMENSLAVKFPSIAKEWHPTKNGRLKPEYLDAHSHYNAWWICSKCGNEFCQPVGRRTSTFKKSEAVCSFCSGQRRKIGFNDLETLFPGISKYWCEKENNEINMKLDECAPTSVKYTYWNFGEGPKRMQIRNAIRRYQNINQSKNK